MNLFRENVRGLAVLAVAPLYGLEMKELEGRLEGKVNHSESKPVPKYAGSSF